MTAMGFSLYQAARWQYGLLDIYGMFPVILKIQIKVQNFDLDFFTLYYRITHILTS